MAGLSERERLLQVRDLVVEYPGDASPPVAVVDGVTLDVAAGEAVGVVGESGSGKTTLALSLLGLLPPGAHAARLSQASRPGAG